MNEQPISKQKLRVNGALDVHSIFKTIQGEGPFVGRLAVFIRLAGCTLQCPGCDTDYTKGAMRKSPTDVVTAVQELSQRPLVVITGGEPFRQNITPLVVGLLGKGYQVQIETNGTVFCPGPWEQCTIVCSPKSGSLNQQLLRHISFYKYVLDFHHVDKDGLPSSALGNPYPPARPPFGVPRSHIYVQPMDEKDDCKNKHNLAACINSVKEFGYTLCLQIHKIIGVD